jgi:acyl-CoA thioesterase
MELETTESGPAHPILQDDYATQWMGIDVIELGDGRAMIEMTLRREMLNGFGMAHGGIVFAFADTAFALACNDPNGDGSTVTVASGADVNFLKPSFAGQRLTAVANRRNQAGRSGLYDVQVFAENQVIAEFRGRSRTIPNPKPRSAG